MEIAPDWAGDTPSHGAVNQRKRENLEQGHGEQMPTNLSHPDLTSQSGGVAYGQSGSRINKEEYCRNAFGGGRERKEN